MKLLRPLVVGLLTCIVPLGTVPLAHATFRSSATATTTFSTASVAPPSDVGATLSCTLNLLSVLVSASLKATWTPSSTPWVASQSVVVTDQLGTVISKQSLAPTASSTSVALPLTLGGSYTVRITAVYEGWTSSAATTVAGC